MQQHFKESIDEKRTIIGSGKAFKREKLAPLFVYLDMEGITTIRQQNADFESG